MDVLPDRTAETLVAWLRDHPDIEVICRERAGPYAEGARRGAPDAVQVADRWHLLRNLGDVLERVVKRNRAALVDTPPEGDGASDVAVTPVEGPLADRTRQRHAEVHELDARGVGHTAICEGLGLDLKTVHRYLRAASPEDLLAPRPTSLDPYKAYLARRYTAGCTDGARLWTEVREQGHGGCHRSVRRYLNTLGDGPARSAQSPEFTARQVCQWILRRPDRLDDDDRERLRAICERSPTLATVTQLVQGFAQLLRGRRGAGHLIAWIEAVEGADIPELHAFAAGLRKDWAAVTAGLTLPWSSGGVEGHVNRIKMLKQQMYGRAEPGSPPPSNPGGVMADRITEFVPEPGQSSAHLEIVLSIDTGVANASSGGTRVPGIGGHRPLYAGPILRHNPNNAMWWHRCGSIPT